MPRLAYIERLTPAQLSELAEDSAFRATVPFRAAFRIAPSIRRRATTADLVLRAVLFREADTDAVVQALEAAGASDAKILDDRPLGGAAKIVFTLPPSASVSALEQIEDVRWVEEVAEIVEDNVAAAGTIQSGDASTHPMWDRGLHGEGQVIGIIDGSPLDIGHCFFRDAPDNDPGPGHRKVVQIRNASGDAPGGHATFVAGCAAGDDVANTGGHARRGGAWAARIASGNNRDLGDTSLFAELTAAGGAGARIHSNSWHDNTEGAGQPATYNQNAADVDGFTWANEDHLVLGSAGNTGEEQGPPGTAKNAICVGAAAADPNEMALCDGNPGPTADGRRKPDLVAVGGSIQSAQVDTTCGTGPRSGCATSYATPHAAAAATLVRQYLREGWYPTGRPNAQHRLTPSGALLKAILVNSSRNMTQEPGYPSDMEGWGLIHLRDVMFFDGSPPLLWILDCRHADGLATGETQTRRIDIASGARPLKVTLAWSDPAGSAGADDPKVNDLDLIVEAPDGETFLGNRFSGGISTPGGAADDRNTVEVVLVELPAPGRWTITVAGAEVNVAEPGQGYALAVTGRLGRPPEWLEPVLHMMMR